MADSGGNTRRDASPSSRPALTSTRPRTRPSDQQPDPALTNSKKGNGKPASVASVPDEELPRRQSPGQTTLPRERPEGGIAKPSATTLDNVERPRSLSKPSPVDGTLSQAKLAPSEPDRTLATSKSGPVIGSPNSGWSGETVTTSPPGQGGSGKATTAKLRKQPIAKLHAMNFLDTDSPLLTSEAIQRTVKDIGRLSPDTIKSTSPLPHRTSFTANGHHDDPFVGFGGHETDRSISPEHSVNEDQRGRATDETGPRAGAGKRRRRGHGTPEMPRGHIQQLSLPPEDLTPRATYQHFGRPPPRAEKAPLTGYELLASRLSALSADRNGPLRPIYRRFEALNHRILLHLQDEICELEEQLQGLDTQDTQLRRLPNGIIPASRRADYSSNGEFGWHRTDLLAKIAFKLDQYNRVLSSFRQTLNLPSPTPTDTQDYRIFLSNYAPIADVETFFLDATDDLVCLSYSDEYVTPDEDEIATPTSRSDIPDFRRQRRVSILSQSDTSRRYDDRMVPSSDHGSTFQEQRVTRKPLLALLSIAMAVATIVPILTFLVIPGFVGRMTVASLIGVGALGALVQGEVIELRATQELCVSIGLYGGVMALLAGMI
ncbi:hypothetical protein F4777DRAFT_591158 [Nemania sp. FL0916]|nr:hypothetical protein F4777DRAFT_591158 [Nemania sp. FL0916]